MPTTTLPQYRLFAPGIVASGQVDRGILPVIVRDGFTYQYIQLYAPSSYARDLRSGAIPKTFLGLMEPFGTSDLPYGEVEVVDDTFEGESASLFLGPYEIVSGRDYVTGGGVAVTAANLGAAIDALPEYTTNVVGATVEITGQPGRVMEDELRLSAKYRGGAVNFALLWPNEEGFLGFPTTSPLRPPEDF